MTGYHCPLLDEVAIMYVVLQGARGSEIPLTALTSTHMLSCWTLAISPGSKTILFHCLTFRLSLGELLGAQSTMG